MQFTPPIVSAIVVSFNTCAMTVGCLRALYAELDGLSAEVFVVDNASSDDSVTAVRREFPQATLIANERNVGFGAANNQALSQARGDYFLLLNSDAFLKSRALQILIDFLRHHPGAGVVGPRLLNADGSLQCSCHHFPSPWRCWLENLGLTHLFSRHPALGNGPRWSHGEQRNVDFVIGACLLVRRAVYDRIGGFDECFFMYQEETDWQRRIHAAGWTVAFLPTAEAVHLGGASGTNEAAWINHQFFESLDKYQLKHHGRRGFFLMRAAMVTGCLLRLGLWSVAALYPPLRERASRRIRWLRWLLRRQASESRPILPTI